MEIYSKVKEDHRVSPTTPSNSPKSQMCFLMDMRTRWWVCSTVSVGGPVGHVAIIRRSFFRWCLGNIQASLSLLGPKNWELASWDLCFCYFTLKVTHILKLPTLKNSGSKEIKTQDVNSLTCMPTLTVLGKTLIQRGILGLCSVSADFWVTISFYTHIPWFF